MFYAIISEDAEESLEKRLAARPRHLERLQQLKEQGRLLLAGPHPAIDSEDPGVAEFPSLAEATAWADADPYVDAGVYARVTVKPFKKVLP